MWNWSPENIIKIFYSNFSERFLSKVLDLIVFFKIYFDQIQCYTKKTWNFRFVLFVKSKFMFVTEENQSLG
jgi:hypothetical protein